MPVTYAVTKCRNPKNPDANYFKGTVQKTGELTMEKLAKRINDSTTVTTADCYAVLKSMKQHIVEALHEGQVVVLEDIGAFTVSLRGKCYSRDAMTAEDFMPGDKIKGVAVTFRPEAEMLKNLRLNYKLNRVSSEAMA